MEDRHTAEIFGISATKFRRAKYSRPTPQPVPTPVHRTHFVPKKPPFSARIVGFVGYATTQLSFVGLIFAVVCGYNLTLTHGVVIGITSTVAMIFGLLMICLYRLTAAAFELLDRAVHSEESPQ